LPPEIYRVYQEGDDMHYSILKVHHISIYFLWYYNFSGSRVIGISAIAVKKLLH
jgi:hypothetical protein